MKKIVISILAALLLPSAYADDLAQVYQMAKQNDARLHEAVANRDARLEARPLAWSGLLPRVAVDGDLAYQSREHKDSGLERDEYNTSALSLGVVQPLYRRDRLMRLDQADWQVTQAEADYASVEQDLLLRTAKVYFDVLNAQDTLAFKQSEKTAIARQLDQAKQRFDVGLIAITDVLEAQAGYDQANTDVIIADNQLFAMWEALREIIAVRPAQLSSLKEEISLIPPEPASIDEWTAIGFENSPRVKSASDATQIAQKEMDVQYSGHFPTLDAYGSYGLSRSDSALGADVDSATIGLRLNVPLYSGGGVRAATRQAGHYLVAAQDRLDQTRRAVDREVRNSYRDVHASISAVKSLQAGTVSAKSAVEATKAGFEVGTRTMVDVLNEQSDLFQAKSRYATARYAYLISKLSLKRAVGMLTEADLKRMNELLEAPTAVVK